MLGLPIKSILEPRRLVVAAPHATVAEAARLMKKGRVGAVLVVEEGRLVGIFTERDALFRVIACGLDPESTPLHEVMTADPVVLRPDDSVAVAIHKMAVGGFRHIPLVVDGSATGIVSARDLFRYILDALA